MGVDGSAHWGMGSSADFQCLLGVFLLLISEFQQLVGSCPPTSGHLFLFAEEFPLFAGVFVLFAGVFPQFAGEFPHLAEDFLLFGGEG